MEFIGAMYPSSGQEMSPSKEALAMSAAVLGLPAICILCIQIVTSTNTHTHILSLSLSLSCCFSFPLSFLFFPLPLSLSLSAAKTLTHVPLSTVIDIHLCVSRPTPFLPPSPLAPSTGCFSCSARMNLIAQMCVKLYFCIRRQSHISQAEQQQRNSSARHGAARGGSTSCARSARCGCASCCYSGFPSHTVSQVCVGASECVCVCVLLQSKGGLS